MTTTALTSRLEPQFADEPQDLNTMQMIGQLLAVIKSDPDKMEKAAGLMGQMVALRQSEERFAWERETRQANIDFDSALNRCQRAIGIVLPDCEASNRIWASYKQLNKVVRPLYTEEGFSISFTEAKAAVDGRIKLVALVSRNGITRPFEKEMTPVTVGAQGKAVMNMTDAEASIESRIKRYLIKDIFNITVGTDEDELRGMTVEQADYLQQHVEQMKNSETLEDCREAYSKAYAKARELKNNEATLKVIDVFEQCKAEFARAK